MIQQSMNLNSGISFGSHRGKLSIFFKSIWTQIMNNYIVNECNKILLKVVQIKCFNHHNIFFIDPHLVITKELNPIKNTCIYQKRVKFVQKVTWHAWWKSCDSFMDQSITSHLLHTFYQTNTISLSSISIKMGTKKPDTFANQRIQVKEEVLQLLTSSKI